MAEASLPSTAMLGVSLVVLFLLVAVQEAASHNPGAINYDAMRADDVPGRPVLDHPVDAANRYRRGCDPVERCRDQDIKPMEHT
jgi:hypothetical protein